MTAPSLRTLTPAGGRGRGLLRADTDPGELSTFQKHVHQLKMDAGLLAAF